MLADCAAPRSAPLALTGTDDEVAEPFELLRLEDGLDGDAPARSSAASARAAAARFLADVRGCWLHQRAPAEVEVAYAASVRLARSPLLLARYEPARLSAAAAEEELRSRPCEVHAGEVAELAAGIVRARRGGPVSDCEAADASEQRARLLVETELREVWPP
jgi:hypothetical protein